MPALLDAFWRAVAYCLHPRVILLSVLPLVLTASLAGVLGYFFWTQAIDQVLAWLQASQLMNSALAWLDVVGAGKLKMALPLLIIIFVATPLLVIVSLLMVALWMTPMLVKLVAKRRFADLEQRQGASFLACLGWSLGSAAMALAALVLSLPLWLIPGVVFLLPPLIWGWLSYRVMAFDALALHATTAERRTVLRQHRLPLLFMGVATGLMGVFPGGFWSAGVLLPVLAPLLLPLVIWVYILVFTFSALWFVHYCLAALRDLRLARAV